MFSTTEESCRVTDCNETLDALTQSEERFRMMFEFAPIGMVITDLAGQFIRVNPAMCELVGYSSEELCRLSFKDITHPDDLVKDLQLLERLRSGEIQRFILEKRYICKDGSVIDVSLYASALHDAAGEPQYFIGQIVDMTERKRYLETMKHMAYHDTLTGLPNRLMLRDKLVLALAQARVTDTRLALIFLDLDRFKLINDTLGHYMGDKALKMIAERLAAAVRRSDMVTRLGGDEFTILIPDLMHEEDVKTIIEKIADSLRRPIKLEGMEFEVGASFGVAVYPRDGQTADALLQFADRQMYEEKQKRN